MEVAAWGSGPRVPPLSNVAQDSARHPLTASVGVGKTPMARETLDTRVGSGADYRNVMICSKRYPGSQRLGVRML